MEDVLKFWKENYDEDLEMKNIMFKRILLSPDFVFKNPHKLDPEVNLDYIAMVGR